MVFLLAAILLTTSVLSNEKTSRQYLTTGNWYPRLSDDLTRMLDSFFKNTKNPDIPGTPVGLIGPHAGLVYSGQCAANAYAQLEKRPDLERIIILGTAHATDFYGAAVCDFDYDSTPLGAIPIDKEASNSLAKEKMFTKNNYSIQNEHSIETHLPLLQYMMKKNNNEKFKIIPILMGYLDERDIKKMADTIKKYITPKTLVIASSDFTHYGAAYGYTPFRNNIKENLTKLDMGMINLIKKRDLKNYWTYKLKTDITMCGFIAVGVLLQIFESDDYTCTLTDYYKSADRNNDYSFSVSYASLVFSRIKRTANPSPSSTSTSTSIGTGDKNQKQKNDEKEKKEDTMKLGTEEKKTLLTLARQTLEDYFAGKNLPLPEAEKKYSIPNSLKERAGVFVTLREKGDLRGCIGTIIGIEPLWEAVRNNSLKSAFEDPRFEPLQKKELEEIDIEISVMTPLQPLEDYKKIRLGIDGVIIRKDMRQALFLPQVATETGWNLDEFLGQLCLKAGLMPNAYRSPGMEFFIFQALVFNEKELKK